MPSARVLRSTAVLGAVASWSVANGGEARAELQDAARRVAEAWRSVGAFVVVGKPRFLNDDETIAVPVPSLPDGNCTTLVLLGARGLSFHVSPPGDSGQHVPSEAGALSIEQCGDLLPRRLMVTSDSGRGALEILVAVSEKSLPALQSVLPERTGGGLGPLPEPGALPLLPAPEKRADLAEVRAKRDGATISNRSIWYSGVDGTGVGEETLPPGCHVFDLFASESGVARAGRKGKLDLDAEMRDSSDDRLLARDRTDAPDVQLPVCVGETTQVGIVFVGAPSGTPVLVSHAAWALPQHLPSIWGGEARARMAYALLARHVVSLPAEAVQLAQGGSGTTPVPLSIEPGACYLAVASLVQGVAHSFGLRLRVRAREVVDDRGVDESSAVVAFCAGDRSLALAQMEARGTPLLGWGLALFRIENGIWDSAP
ncbi:MAG TPA: hypothetical protein VEK07_22735 [Polyangiaceae bacterium]|nr:hypothetical protein [Polyangiaceae bacterium]